MKLKQVSLKSHPNYNEKWLQDQIAEDPTILGLGNLSLRAKEKVQASGGRLDLLLEDLDADTPKRYECELQLGATDESHIIRTIEYWDLERKRYPQYDHTAVLVAEDVTRCGGSLGLAVSRLFCADGHETDIELTFNYPVGRGFSVQPAIHAIRTDGSSAVVGQLRLCYELGN